MFQLFSPVSQTNKWSFWDSFKILQLKRKKKTFKPTPGIFPESDVFVSFFVSIFVFFFISEPQRSHLSSLFVKQE